MADYFQFEHEELSSTTEAKPIPFANQPLTYSGLSSRQFESLNYFIFKRKIEREPDFRSRHDRIQLMPGVSEQGRDCALFNGNKFSGLIQCKRYGKPVTEPDCLKEIIKPVLHALIGNLNIADPNSFEYFFVASDGFSGPANSMLGDFSSFIDGNELKIRKAVEKLKKAHVALKTIDYAVIRTQLISMLKSIKIEQVIGNDLDNELLTLGSETIISNFFSVRPVTDNTAIENLTKELIAQKSISVETVHNRFETASLQLSQYTNIFQGIADSHIPRQETDEIINWINAPLQRDEQPVKLLVGEPGGGKSVILRDVYDKLREKRVSVVAFKADRYKVSSVSQLQTDANLPDSLEDCVRALVNKGKRLWFSLTK